MTLPSALAQACDLVQKATVAKSNWDASDTQTSAEYRTWYDADTAALDACVNLIRAHGAELGAMVRDAERYRWLREANGDAHITALNPSGWGPRNIPLIGADADLYIDTALRESARRGGDNTEDRNDG